MREPDSNHTGFDPWLLSIVLVLTALVVVVALLRGASLRAGLFACVIGFGGLAFLFYLVNVLVSYDRWLERGQPESALR
jgi:energy-coupling factor transporter transmembrane protein EcfT